ncbi:hypothetical protein N0V95_009914 [Ascochyta clinopodiicola]|nr:hypothetical protein N0V95_009914 [Ascochyta clinopodiicola]
MNHSLIEMTYRTRDGGGEEFNTGPQQFPRGGLRNISCRTQNANYSAHVSYRNLIQKVTLDVLGEQPMDEWWTGWPLNSLLLTKPSANGSIDTTDLGMSLGELYEFYHKIQVVAVKDMLWNQLSGYVINFGDFQLYNTSSTIVQETPLAEWVYDIYSRHYTDIYFDLSPRTVERLMHNVTISLLNDASTTTLAEVTSTEYKAAYVFKDQPRLLAAYACTLVVCLVFVLLGLFALLQNGTPAFSGGFIQTLYATTHAASISNQMAKDASLRGTQHVPENVARLQLRYGLVSDEGSERKYAAFGTVEETEVLLKGSSAQHR